MSVSIRRRSRSCSRIAPGLRGNADDNSIYGIFARRASSGHGWLAAPKMVLSEYLLKDRLARHPGGRYSYSNTGYEILSAIIEEQTGQHYEDYCGEAVFGKLGLAVPKLHPDWRMLAGAGGWFVPGPDYLAFLDVFDPANPFLGDTVKAWIDRAQKRWTPTNSDRWYSLGVNTWAGAGRWAVSHGGICTCAAGTSRVSRLKARSSATRSGPPTAPRCSSRWNGFPRPQFH